jgi:hypothetical protein
MPTPILVILSDVKDLALFTVMNVILRNMSSCAQEAQIPPFRKGELLKPL